MTGERSSSTHMAGERSRRDLQGGESSRRNSHGGGEEQRADAQQAGRHVVREVVVVEEQAGHQVQHDGVGHNDGRKTLLSEPRARLVLLYGGNLILNLLQHLKGGLLPLQDSQSVPQ